MDRNSKRKISLSLAVLAALIVVILGGRYIFFAKLRAKLVAGIEELQKKGFQISYSSLETVFWKGEIALLGLDMKFPPDGLDSANRVVSTGVTIKGFEILPLILRKEIHIRSVASGKFFARYVPGNHSSFKKDRGSMEYQGIFIDHFQVDSANLEILDSATSQVSRRVRLTLNAQEIEIHDPLMTSMSWAVREATVAGLRLEFPLKFYTLTMLKFVYQRSEKYARMDSLKIVPDYDKVQFAIKNRTQIDRISGTVPRIEMHGVELHDPEGLPFYATSARVNFELSVFRDKRYPFKKKYKRLPSKMLRDLPFKIQVDTLLIDESNLAYEEFPEDGAESGKVYFNSLKGTFYNVSNVSTQSMILKAQARFMNTGDLKADFTFPADPAKTYTAEGTLTNFDLKKINGVLIPLAHAEARSGKLNSLMFRFEYNDYRSDGKLTLDYDNLNLVRLTKSKEKLPNSLLTMILNAFVKKNLDKNKTRGTILFYRDTDRSVFNFWWKSIFSGIKSIYNLDKVIDIHHNKEKK